MTNNTKELTTFDSTNLIVFLLKWWKPLGFITAVAAIASVIFSGPAFIDPKYESTVVLFPSTTTSISKVLLSEKPIKKDILEFGKEGEAEQLLQILNSDEIRNRIIEKYDLMKHYKIVPEKEKYPRTKLHKKYKDNISFRRTEFMSVEIKVLDTDPDTAALIANDIANLLDVVKNRMQKKIAVLAFAIVEGEYKKLKTYIKSIEDSLQALGELGIYDYLSQSEVMNLAYANAIARSDKKAIEALEEKLKILGKYGNTQMSLAYNLEYEAEKLSRLKTKYEEAKVDANQQLPHKFIVNMAYPAEKKSYPTRWLIVVISTFSAFLLVIVLLILMEQIKQFRKGLIKQ